MRNEYWELETALLDWESLVILRYGLSIAEESRMYRRHIDVLLAYCNARPFGRLLPYE